MSLSHLYLHLKNDLHINNSTDLHQSFPWLHPVQAKFTTIRVLSVMLSSHAQSASYLLYAFTVNEQRLALQINSLIRVSRRALLNSLTLDQVQALFTKSVMEFFSSFVHTTCNLSVSSRYLALDGAYHPLKTPLSKYPTLSNTPKLTISLRGFHSESHTHSTYLDRGNKDVLSTFPTCAGLRRWAFPSSIAFTEGILVSFFTSA